MSREVCCEHCGARGFRKLMHPAPPDWLFFVTKIDDDEPEIGEMVLYACSEKCSRAIWQKGPGEQFSADPVPAERFIPIRNVLGALAYLRETKASGPAEFLRGLDDAIRAVRATAADYGCDVN